MEMSLSKEQPCSLQKLLYGFKHKYKSKMRKMSLLNQRNENSIFWKNSCYLMCSYAHFHVKTIPLNHFYVNIDGMTSKLEYCKGKSVF